MSFHQILVLLTNIGVCKVNGEEHVELGFCKESVSAYDFLLFYVQALETSFIILEDHIELPVDLVMLLAQRVFGSQCSGGKYFVFDQSRLVMHQCGKVAKNIFILICRRDLHGEIFVICGKR